MGKKIKQLNEKQQLFVKEYLIDLNATQAAIRARYSAKTAHSIGPKLLQHIGVKKQIDEAMRKRGAQVEVTAERVLQEYARLGFFDIRNLYDENGALRQIVDLDDSSAAAVSSIKNEELFDGHGEDREHIGRMSEVKTYDKRAALSDIGRHLGMFAKDNAQQRPSQFLFTGDINDMNLTTEQKMKALQAALSE